MAYSESSNNDDYNQRMIKCPHWDRKFSAQGLGGHKAKAHKGMNTEYQRKLEVRNRNKPNMSILRLAQFSYLYDRNMLDMQVSLIPRSKTISYKKQIRELIEELQIEEYLTESEAIEKLQQSQEQLRIVMNKI